MSQPPAQLLPATLGMRAGVVPPWPSATGWIFYETRGGVDYYNAYLTPEQARFVHQALQRWGGSSREYKPGHILPGFERSRPLLPRKEKVTRTPFSVGRWLAVRLRRAFRSRPVDMKRLFNLN